MQNLVVLGGLILTMGFIAEAQQPQSPTPQPGRTERSREDADATYGRIKEITRGQKIVIHVENALDKSYDLKDEDTVVRISDDLAVGDPVKVTESEEDGKKSVQIVRDTRSGGKRGDAERSRTPEPEANPKP